MSSEARLRFYTTAGCHLCEQAERMLERVLSAVDIDKIDIAESDALIAAYGERIPVLKWNNKELGWPFSLLDLKAFLRV